MLSRLQPTVVLGADRYVTFAAALFEEIGKRGVIEQLYRCDSLNLTRGRRRMTGRR